MTCVHHSKPIPKQQTKQRGAVLYRPSAYFVVIAALWFFPLDGGANCGTRPPGRVISHKLPFTSKAFPLVGEGGWPQARRMRGKPKVTSASPMCSRL